MSPGQDPAEFCDPEIQGRILVVLIREGHLTYRELAEEVDVVPSVAAANCGGLMAKGWVGRQDGGIEITLSGADAVRRMFPSKRL